MLSDRQQHCLKGIGIELWAERTATTEIRPETEPVSEVLTNDEIDDIRRFAQRPEQAHDHPVGDIPSQQSPALPVSIAPAVEPVVPVGLDSWDSIITAIDGCIACELAQNCTRKVPGVGNRQADLLIVGEGPGQRAPRAHQDCGCY